MTGSASGGLSIALKALGETYYQRGIDAINPELCIASHQCRVVVSIYCTMEL